MLNNCQMNETKLEISERYEETELSDYDDDIFVKTGGKNGFRLEFSDTSKKPLMTPRKRKKSSDHFLTNGFHTEVRSSPPAFRVLCMPICYIIIATFALLGLIAVIAFLSHYVTIPKSMLKFWNKNKSVSIVEDMNLIAPCDKITIKDVWVKKFPKLLTESAFRMVDVNSDGTQDVVFGFATGADGYNVPSFVCDIYFKSQTPCFGGVIALNGKDGSEIWRVWSEHEVFALNCNEDINKDSIFDCLASGRAGVFFALSGKDGKILWTFNDEAVRNPIMNIYTAQFVRDLNNDGVLDILAVHGGDPLAEPGSKTRLTGRLILLDGANGKALQWIQTPDGQESYYSPQIITKLDGIDWVLFGTGGETHGGGLYVISLQDLLKGFTGNIQTIYKDDKKGIMAPPVLTDVNRDGVFDIVMSMFNSTVIAFDGNNYKQLWNHTFPSSETYTTPTPGYFNDDTIPDFLVKYQTGPGFPVYYHAQTTILDGKNGIPLLDKPLLDSIGSQSSTPLIRVQGYGNDLFLYWSSNCKGHEGNSTAYKFVKGTNVHEQTRSDLCKLRFDSTLINQLRAFNQATGLPGTIIYDSDLRNEVEHQGAIDSSLDGQEFLKKHPEMWQYYGQDSTRQEYADVDNQNPQEAEINGGGVGIGGRYDDLEKTNPQQIPSDPLFDQSYKRTSTDQLQYMNMNNIPSSSYNVPLNRRRPSYNNPYQGYPMASQPELTEDVKYPIYHNVRKHGGGGGSGDAGEYRSLPNTNMNPNAQWDGGYDDVLNRNYNFNNRRSRPKRHIGPHDNDGIQRLISTGTLAKPLNASSSADAGIDLIFATYWFFPAKTEAVILKSSDCIQKKLLEESIRFDESSKYYGMDHDSFEDAVTNECKLIEENNQAEQQQQQSDSHSPGDEVRNNVYESQSAYNPFDIHMGQMTVYRLHISCTCSEQALISKDGSTKRRCGKILEDQPWSGYMGSHADSYFPFHSH